MTDGMVGEREALVREPLVAFRSWSINDQGLLVSQYVKWIWADAKVTAEHLNAPAGWGTRRGVRGKIQDKIVGHWPPVKSCSCGLYGYYSPQKFQERGRFRWAPNEAAKSVTGACVCTGRVQAHAMGLRAERMRILCLARWKEHDSLLCEVADRYGVPLVDPDGLLEYAKEFGVILPEEWRGTA